MDFKNVLITGGAGFVGANLAIGLKSHCADVHVTSLDNLCRRGSELNLPRLKKAGVQFIHGDVRCPEDIASCPRFDLLIDCAAQPSVHAGLDGSPLPVVQSNLQGTINCAEAARRYDAAVFFLSTSRVYPIAKLNELPFQEEATRYRWTDASVPGFSSQGIAETFPLDGARSLYGATKLASELLLQEYAYSYKMPVLINRCGLLTGPWQMGKVDQGVITYWITNHLFGRPLRYTGFGGHGKQVRDLLHVEDLLQLLLLQAKHIDCWRGDVFNVGGGNDVSTSLLELTQLCREMTGNKVPITPIPETAAVDLRLYVADTRRAQTTFSWQPHHNATQTVAEITEWARQHGTTLAGVL